MKLLKSTLMASALILGTATVSFAQSAMTDKAKDIAVDAATDMAKDKAKSVADPAKLGGNLLKGDSLGEGASLATKSLDTEDKLTAGKVLLKGGSKEDAAMAVVKGKAENAVQGKADGLTGGLLETDKSDATSLLNGQSLGGGAALATQSMSTEDKLTAGKVLLKGGSKEDAAMAVVKGKTENAVKDKADSMMKEQLIQGGTIKSAAPLSAPAVSAPSVPAINCPYGTTAQANGTCMVTGDYK